MRIIKKFESFVSEELVMGANPAPTTTPTPTPTTTPTPTRPRPSRPGITPTEVPSEQDAPLASAEKVIDRLKSVYTNASEEDKKEIDSYFEQK
jgi:hypothetical protein